MTSASIAQTRAPRKVLPSVLLSIAAPGLGHIYCGRINKGLVLFFISFAFAPVVAAVARHTASTLLLAAVLASVLLMVGVFVYAAVDAGLLARRVGGAYEPKNYNCWYIYLLFILVSFIYPTHLAGGIRDNLLQAFCIPSTSMVPSVLPGDYVLVNKAVYKNQPVRRGDIIVFIYPDNRSQYFIKRIVALPGETIEIRDNRIFINDRPFVYAPGPAVASGQESQWIENNGRVAYTIILPDKKQNLPRQTVPHGSCFVLGDNRGHSRDSRHFGPVPLADVKGRLDYIHWPAQSWSRFGRFVYDSGA